MTENKEHVPARVAEFDAATQAMPTLHVLVTNFQFLEEALKLYIETAYEFIRLRTVNALPFKLDRTTVENTPLRKLIGVFSNLVDDDALISELMTLVEPRNKLAHRAFMQAWQARGDRALLKNEMESQREIAKRVHAATDRILEHATRIVAKTREAEDE